MKKAIGVYVLSNWGGIEVLEVNDDTITWRYNYGSPQEEKESDIDYGENGFFADDIFVSFEEVMSSTQ